MKPVHVIIGAGQAGDWAAIAMRQQGFDGRIVMIGEEAWLPYERPPLSKRMLTETLESPPQFFRDARLYEQKNIELLLRSRAEGIDVTAARVRLDSGETIPFDRLLIATGGSPRRLAVPGAEHADMLRTVDDARRLRKAIAKASKVVCVGAGVIGLEVAASAAALGREVVVLEAGPAPMGRSLAAECVAFVVGLHGAAGVDLRFGTTVAEIAELPSGRKLVVGSDSEAIECDLVVAAIGIERRDSLASAAGLAVNNGILVDAFGRTDADGIYAAGDVAALFHPLYGGTVRLESWAHAQNHGSAVGQAMSGGSREYDHIPWFWSDQFDVKLEVVGSPAIAATTIVRPQAGPNELVAIHLSDQGVVVGVTAANNPGAIRIGRKAIQLRRQADPALLEDPDISLAVALQGADARRRV